MQFIIIDWMSNVCFKSDLENFITFEAASEALDNYLYQAFGDDCDLEIERDEYSIIELTSRDKVIGNIVYQFNAGTEQ